MYKIGIGFDVHALSEGCILKIGGVEIPHYKGLIGHSDADVLVHAIMDAILGAFAFGDIGQHFPDTSSKYKNANSLELLSYIYKLADEKGFTVSNLDCIVMAEKPKISTYILKMRENLAIALNTDIEIVSVKATTTEKLGIVGREEGIAAQAVILLKSSN